MRLWPGSAYPLGATWLGDGVNFAVFSEQATAVDLCLFDRPGEVRERARLPLTERTNGVWHGFLPDARPGLAYGYRVTGPYDPRRGLRCNPAKLLVDPYAKALGGELRWHDALYGYRAGDPAGDAAPDDRDSAPYVPKAIVVDPAFAWGDDRRPRTPWSRTIIYECHVKGLTIRHPGVPDRHRGTYLGLASDVILDHLVSLGVTAVELLPVHHRVTEHRLFRRGLSNYWGYNTLGYFAPDARFATGADGEQVAEFKAMVRALHGAGIEVLLDVVYNHTAESDHRGPTLSLRGLDNPAYYVLDPEDPRHYRDFTGTGNTLNMQHARTMQLMMDSLRYWVREMRVDGFRFDLAPALVRNLYHLHRLGWFFDVIQQDPILAEAKLIAEPWDLGEGGYHVGRFPPGWAEWNGRFRDTVRRFWRGDDGQVADLGYRLAGSSDLYNHRGRTPHAGINFVTSHDGFTLQDLVSYGRKQNAANGERNADGTDANWSRSWGVEGPSDDPDVVRVRERMKRNLMATLALSQGVPMLSHGDEVGRTQRGNNNAYCHDDDTTWVNWEPTERATALLEFTRRLLLLRRRHPVFRRRSFFRESPPGADRARDVTWLRGDGDEMAPADWHDPDRRTLGMLIHGEATDETDERGHRILGRSVCLIVHAGGAARDFVLPAPADEGGWLEEIDTAREDLEPRVVGPTLRLAPRSLVLLTWQPDAAATEAAHG